MPAAAAKNRLLIPSKLQRVPFYGLVTRTGLITAIAAATASAGHLIAVRNTGAPAWHIMRMRLEWLSEVDPSTAQRVGFLMSKLSAYTVAHSGGTGAATGNPHARAEATATTTYPALTAVAHRTAGTDALTAGTQTIGATVAQMHDWALVPAATVKQTRFSKEWVASDKHPLLIIGQNEGLLVRNAVLMANNLAGYLELELEGYVKTNSGT
jgi:hypothetical protein